MKKLLALVFILVAGLTQGQLINAGASTAGRLDTVTATNGIVTTYIGSAVTTATKAAPSTNEAVWRITRTVSDTNGVVISWGHAYGSGTGDLSLSSTAWTNRYNATYK